MGLKDLALQLSSCAARTKFYDASTVISFCERRYSLLDGAAGQHYDQNQPAPDELGDLGWQHTAWLTRGRGVQGRLAWRAQNHCLAACPASECRLSHLKYRLVHFQIIYHQLT